MKKELILWVGIFVILAIVIVILIKFANKQSGFNLGDISMSGDIVSPDIDTQKGEGGGGGGILGIILSVISGGAA